MKKTRDSAYQWQRARAGVFGVSEIPGLGDINAETIRRMRSLRTEEAPGWIREGPWVHTADYLTALDAKVDEITARTDYRDLETPFFSSLVHEAAKVELAALAMGIRGGDSVVFGTAWDSDVNAFAARARCGVDPDENEGSFVLVQHGLAGLVFLTAKVVARTWGMASKQTPGSVASFSADLSLVRQRVTQDKDIAEEFLQILEAFVFRGDPWGVRPNPMEEDDNRQIILSLLTRLSERFVVAHEYAHVFNDHQGRAAAYFAESTARGGNPNHASP